MSDPIASCRNCAHYNAAWTETGKTGMRERCDEEDSGGVATLHDVQRESDCPYFMRIYIGTQEDVYPKRILKKDEDSKPWVTTVGVDTIKKKQKPPKRTRDNY